MPSLLKSRRFWAAMLAALVFWCLTPYHRGLLVGHIDHARGHYELKLYGGPPLTPPDEEKLSRFARLLGDRYGVELKPVAGCVVSWGLQQYSDGYNDASRRLLLRKHGKDIFRECERLVWPPWELCQVGDPGVVPDGAEAPSDRVENGRAYDKATIEIDASKGLVVPGDAKVAAAGAEGRVEVFLEKRLSYAGHPPDRMSIRDERRKMGLATRAEGGKLVVATCGEWDSDIEGGARMRVLLRVPPGLPVEHRQGLSGPVNWFPPPARKERERVTPGEGGWKAVPDEPDPRHTAKTPER
jgi:hypothetical protein